MSRWKLREPGLLTPDCWPWTVDPGLVSPDWSFHEVHGHKNTFHVAAYQGDSPGPVYDLGWHVWHPVPPTSFSWQWCLMQSGSNCGRTGEWLIDWSADWLALKVPDAITVSEAIPRWWWLYWDCPNRKCLLHSQTQLTFSTPPSLGSVLVLASFPVPDFVVQWAGGNIYQRDGISTQESIYRLSVAATESQPTYRVYAFAFRNFLTRRTHLLY